MAHESSQYYNTPALPMRSITPVQSLAWFIGTVSAGTSEYVHEGPMLAPATSTEWLTATNAIVDVIAMRTDANLVDCSLVLWGNVQGTLPLMWRRLDTILIPANPGNEFQDLPTIVTDYRLPMWVTRFELNNPSASDVWLEMMVKVRAL